MKWIFLVLAAGLLIAGCLGPAYEAPAEEQVEEETTEEESPVVEEEEAEPEEEQPVTGDGEIIEVPDTGGEVATSQEDCATLTANCGACVAKSGCGWCKSSNSCLYGDASGPDYGQCQLSEWTVTEEGCLIEADGERCEDQYNCAFCLSGSGCKWCIQGSKCAPADSTEDCFGDWMTESYQCNYASR